MNVITISREYGAGGRELARRLAARLGWELLDQELLHQAAAIEHVPDLEWEHVDEHAVTLADRLQLHPPYRKYLEGLTQAVHQAAARGKVIFVGRGARQLLGARPDCLHLRLVAPPTRRAERIARLEQLTLEAATARCAKVDRSRQQFTRCFFGDVATQPAQYDLVANTGRVALDEVAETLSTVASEHVSREPRELPGTHVLTLARELGAGELSFAPPLANRLGLQVFDRELLEQQADRLGVPLTDLERVDEQPAGIFERLRPGSLHHRYFEALKQQMQELAERGDALLVGRGGSWFLRQHPAAFHVRLVSPLEDRLRRVMEYRWVREELARKLISQSDAQRRSFCRTYFDADWANPLEYDLTVNTGRLGVLAIDLVALAAERYWSR